MKTFLLGAAYGLVAGIFADYTLSRIEAAIGGARAGARR